MIDIIKNYIAKLLVDGPENHQLEFVKRKKYKNLLRMKLFLIFLSFFTFIFFILQLAVADIGFALYLQLSIFIITLFLSYIYLKKAPDNIDDLEKIHNLIFYGSLIFIVGWPVFRVIYFGTELAFFIYILSMFFISVIFYFRWKIYLFLFGVISFLLIFFGVSGFDSFGISLVIVNSLVFGFIASRVSYINLMDNLVELKQTENKYKEVIDHNKRLKNLLSETKEKDEKLKNEIEKFQEKFSFVLENTESGFWEWYIENNRVVYNNEWARMLDYHLNKLDGRLETWRDLVHPLDKDEFDSIVAEIGGGEKESFSFEHRVKSGDGQWRWVMARGKVVSLSETGQPLKVMGIHQNISELKSLQKKLYYRKEEFESIFSSLPFAVMVYQKEGWQFINRAAEDLLGYKRDEILGKKHWKFIDSDYSEWLNRGSSEEPGNFHQMRLIDKTGSAKLVDFYASKIDVKDEELIMLVALEK